MQYTNGALIKNRRNKKAGAEGNIIPQRPSFLSCPKSRSPQYPANHSFVCRKVDYGIESNLTGAYLVLIVVKTSTNRTFFPTLKCG